MREWLTAGMVALGGGLPGRVVDINVSPADVLARTDIVLCLTSGVAVAMGTTPIGFVPGTVLARLLAAAFAETEREARDGRMAREEAKRLRRGQRMLAANLSHELRTPLNAISGYSELVALGLQSGRSVAAAGQNAIIWEAAQSLMGTIDAMLDIARIEADAARLDESVVALRPLAEIVTRMLATLAEARGVTMRVDIAGALPPVYADARILRQIFVNLAGNAIKYGATAKGGKVTFTAHIDRRERMRIEVRDTGTGMTAAAIERAMQPFGRGTLQSDTMQGSGLGLPLVKALAELHEGSFQLLSSQAKGTRAIVTLPAGRVLCPRRGRQEAFAFQRSSELFG